MKSISPFDYGDYHYNYTPQKLAEESKFNSFMQQNNATYFEASDEVFNNTKLNNTKLQFNTFINNTDSPTTKISVIKGYGENKKGIEIKPIDLGLSVLWANKQIVDENGHTLYFQWGDPLSSKNGFELNTMFNDVYDATIKETYKFYDKSTGKYTKYNEEDGLTVIEKEDDMATQILGKDWRLPTRDEIIELMTFWKKTNIYSSYSFKRILNNFYFYMTNGEESISYDCECGWPFYERGRFAFCFWTSEKYFFQWPDFNSINYSIEQFYNYGLYNYFPVIGVQDK